MRHLRAIMFDKNIIEQWKQFVPLVQRIINSKINLSTGVAPCEIILPGVDLNRHMFNKPQSNFNIHLSSFGNVMIDKQKIAIATAEKHLLEHEVKHNITYRKLTRYEKDSLVLLEYPKVMNKKKPPHKLSMLNEGPYIVLDSEESKYKIKNLATNVIKEVHISRLRPYMVDDRMLQPDIVANKDYQYSNIEKIIKHKGNPIRKTGMSFQFAIFQLKLMTILEYRMRYFEKYLKYITALMDILE